MDAGRRSDSGHVDCAHSRSDPCTKPTLDPFSFATAKSYTFNRPYANFIF